MLCTLAMRYSSAFIPTLKEIPRDATTPSHILLLRGGFIRMVGAGIYEMLPLGHRVLRKITEIVREEMDRAGAQEVLMPALLPRQYFEETGRWDLYGEVLFRLRDRKGGDYHLGPTHEEIITDMVRREVRSYRQLPLNLYQIQMKYRDEPRPRAGLLRCREFLMKDAYSFDVDEKSALASYENMREAYHRIFRRLGLAYRVVEADSGAIGGETSAEFQVLAQTGEDAIVACTACQYAANVEVASAQAPSRGPLSELPIERLYTPGQTTIEAVCRFLGVPAHQTIKALLFRVIREKRVSYALVFVRGDDEAQETKVINALGGAGIEIAMATSEEAQKLGLVPGYIGPQGLRPSSELDVLIDRSLDTGQGWICGANEENYHVRNVVIGRDTHGRIAELRVVRSGDPCPRCGGRLESYRGIEGGHIFVLGTHYSAKMRCTFLDRDGQEKPVIMGCYGIGISRLVAAAVEQSHDEDGIIWPMSIAPY
ncbi:MAG: proline--tRNA ligase, partial [Deltaproteobacteria bacterium]|nr:proline--tRNA ligase [Deltaproteobacteria bacterium]